MLIRDLPRFNSIKVGWRYLKPGDVSETITQSCRMVLIEMDDRSLPLARRGSATLIKYGGKNYVVMTRHQFGLPAGSDVSSVILETARVASGKGVLSNILLQRCIFETGNPDEEYHDLLLFETAAHWKTKHLDQPYFFPLTPFSDRQRVKSFLVGNPSIDGVIDEYHENFDPLRPGAINIKRVISECEFDSGFNTNASYFRRYLNVKERPVVDGYSGGAVFSIVGDPGDHEVVLDGIVVRAGKNHVHVIDADYLMSLLAERDGV
ncbi:hypothetical protein [Mesorhizobium sp.]|uniref:hypothetical protein n=1 Tax=Mesorhizobium sp. TaxID=1871066 RepID=UPI000FE3D627|nr:hypothetical protein [Mesorhizobium sp.]RWH69156.1 MAG: hypothetical protein EOQ84_23770 [Mesorhizobium sp.]RWL24468.1 MAG: hypothetical protein EOR63_30160 [Mesorhizobium sp.]RWL26929.1 MAG: hypothetical protein EOR58_16935 [Mesorhizobium sp.]RWL38054.1 MAG: hypothetical protein EOR59_15620 [Mesorhizobium sp.]RWL56844.1 MAG: hypothetical protein EOR62_05505 [Mesorhizobium sp.]